MATTTLVNSKKDQSILQWSDDYVGKAPGQAKVLSLTQKVAAVGKELTDSPALVSIHGTCGQALGAMGMVGIPSATRSAFRALSDLFVENGVAFCRKVSTAFKEVHGALDNWSSGLLIFTGNPIYKVVNKSAMLGKESSDFALSIQDYNDASTLADVASGNQKKAAEYTKSHYFYRCVKNVVSIASKALGVLAVAFGLVYLPPLGTALLGLFSCVLGISVDIHKDSGEFKVLDFKRPITTVEA